MKYLNAFICTTIICISLIQAEEIYRKPFDKLSDNIKLEEYFKDFIWEVNHFEKNGEKFDEISVTIDNNSQTELIGLTIIFENIQSKVTEIKPILRHIDDDDFSWALEGFNKFQNNKISFDTLWEIVASYDSKQSLPEIIVLLSSGLSNYPNIKEVIIQDDGPVRNAVKELGMEKYISDRKIDFQGLFLEVLNSGVSQEISK